MGDPIESRMSNPRTRPFGDGTRDSTRGPGPTRHRTRRFVTLAIGVLLVLFASGCGGAKNDQGTITVGSKDFTESVILGEMLAQLLEAKTDLKINRRLNLGGTDVNFRALRNEDLDMYVEYDGTAYAFHLNIDEPITDPESVFADVNRQLQERESLKFTEPLGFNNTYTLAVPETIVAEYGLQTFSDLVEVADRFVFGVEHEFLNREHDGYPGLREAYGFEFKDVIPMETGLKYRAIQQNEVQLINAFSTDGKLPAFDLIVLEDDKNFFPPYKAAPLVRMETLKKHPELEGVLDTLGGQISDAEMQQMNFLVDEEGRNEVEVVREFLQSKGLI